MTGYAAYLQAALTITAPPLVLFGIILGISCAVLGYLRYSDKNTRSCRRFIQTILIALPLSISAIVAGYLTGESRQPAVTALVPALLTLVGGLGLYLIGQKKSTESLKGSEFSTIGVSIASFSFFLLFGIFNGADQRARSEVFVARETAMEAVNQEYLQQKMRRSLGLTTTDKVEPRTASAAAAVPRAAVTLLTINDIYRIEGLERGRRGGLARVRSLRQELQVEDPELLVLHAGDVIYPSLLSRKYDGEQMIDILNRLDGDPGAFDQRMFAVFGNHEFDKSEPDGADILAARVGQSQFTWLRSNVAFATDGDGQSLVKQPNLRLTKVVEAHGLKVGLFGLTTNVTKPAYVVEIGNRIENARRFSRELRAAGADLVVALTHLTVRQDMAILEALGAAGPDLIIGGHEHTQQKEQVGGRWVLKADADAAGAWVVRVTPRPGEPPQVEAEYRQLAGDLPPPDPEVAQAVRDWQTRHAQEVCAKDNKPAGCLDAEVGQSATLLVAAEEQIRSCETNLGDWIADRMRAAFPGAQAAFINAGSLRLNQNLSAGPILKRDLAELFQYDNGLAEVEISGETLREVAGNAVTGWPGNGRWLQISGFAFAHDQTDRRLPTVEQLELVLDDGTRRPVKDHEMIQVVTTDYLLGARGKGGDRDDYDMLPDWNAVGTASKKPSLVDLVEAALKAEGKAIDPPAPATARRIVPIKEQEPCIVAE